MHLNHILDQIKWKQLFCLSINGIPRGMPICLSINGMPGGMPNLAVYHLMDSVAL